MLTGRWFDVRWRESQLQESKFLIDDDASELSNPMSDLVVASETPWAEFLSAALFRDQQKMAMVEDKSRVFA